MKKTLFALSFLFLLISNSLAQSNALQFNGNAGVGSGSFVQVSSNSNDFNLGSNFTFEAWINPTRNTDNTIVSKGSGQSADGGYIFQLNSGFLQFYNGFWVNSGFTIPINTLSHVAVTYFSTTSTLSFYVNGVNVTSVGTSLNLNPPTGDFSIGNQGISVPSPCLCNRFNGTMDELRVWNYARSQAQISANMSCIVGGTTTGLIAQYSFNQGTANGNNSAITTLIDNSGNGHTGTLQSFTGFSGGSVSNFTSGITDCPAAPASVVSSPAAICAGAVASLSAISAGNNINWYTVSTGGSALGASASTANFTVNPGAITTYYAEAATVNSGTQTFNYTGILQNYTVPSGVSSITIETFGAQGGYGEGGTYTGGLGARMKGTFAVTSGQILKVLVGGKGQDWATYKAGGGGGGSFVTDLSNNPLCIAGGGSGGGGNSNPSNGFPGLTTNNGGNNYDGTLLGGTSGSGGQGLNGSAGGGGLTGNGASSSCSYTTSTGQSFVNGGAGGGGGTCPAGGGAGGFGGGSGGEWCCYGATGAGGGYSGGAGTNNYGVAGGGGSYNSGTNQSNASGVRTGNGMVEFTYNYVSLVSPSRTAVTVSITGQEINLQSNAISIAKGDNLPSTLDGTAFGIVNIGTNKVQNYSIQNSGTTNLSVGGIAISGANASSFSISGINFPVTVGGSGATSFNLVFTSTSQGTKTASVAVLSDDCDEAFYDFTVSGIADYTTPTITGISPSQTVCSGVVMSFTVTALGANLSYQWYKNGVAVAGQTFANLTIAGVTTSSSGVYFAVIQGMVGSVTSSGISLGVGCNNALFFDGAGDAVSIPDQSSFDFTTKYTFESWINLNAYVYGTLVSKFDDDGNNRGWMINFGETGDNTKLCVIQDNTGSWTNPIQWNSGFTPALNTWYHVAITFDATLPSNQIKLYVNGVLFNQTSWNYSMTASAANVYLGGYDNPGNGVNGGVNGRFLNGRLDEIRIWNTALHANDILANYNKNVVGTEPNLVAAYDFNQGIAVGNNTGTNTLIGKTTTAQNGTLNNFTLNGSTSNWISSTTSIAGSFAFSSPSIVGISSSQTVCSGIIVPLSITATGTGLTYQWLKNGVNIVGATSSDITLTGVTATSAGIYSVAISSLGGNITSSGIALGVGCYIPKGVYFNGSQASSPVTLPALSTNNPAFTFEYWVNPGTGGNYKYTPLSFNNNGTGNTNKFFLQMYDFSGTYTQDMKMEAYYYNTSAGASIDFGIPRNKWTHIAVASNPVSGDFRVLVNGIEVVNKLVTLTGIDLTAGAQIKLGEQVPGGENLTGTIDEVRVWQGTRSSAQILANYDKSISSTTTGLLFYSNFDSEGSATVGTNLVNGSTYNLNGAVYAAGFTATGFGLPTVTGVSGNQSVCNGSNVSFVVSASGINLAYNWYKSGSSTSISGQNTSILGLSNVSVADNGVYYATVFNSGAMVTSAGMSLAIGCNNALDFNGTSSYVYVNQTPAVRNLGISGFTLSAWIKPTNVSGIVNSIFRKTNDYNLYINNGKIGVEVWAGGEAGTSYIQQNGTTTIPTNQWTQVTAVWDGASVKLYVNGVSETSSLAGPFSLTGNENLCIGKSLTYSNLFVGGMDELYMWNIPLTKVDIQSNYTKKPAATVTGLVAYFDFDQGIASGSNAGITSLVDKTGNGNNGTLNNFSLSGSTSNWVASGTTISGSFAFNAPTITGITASQTVCSGLTLPLNVTISGGSGAAFQWLKNGSLISGATNSGLTLTGITATSAGIYSVAISSLGGNITSSGIALTLSIPVVGTNASSNAVCLGQLVTLSGTGASTYTFTGGVLNGVGFVPSITTIYSVTGTNALGCTNKAFTTITVNSLPNVGISALSNAVCLGQALTLSGTGASTYTFTGGVLNGVGFVPSITDIYSVTGTNALGCVNSSFKTVTVNSLPNVGVNASSNPVCLGQLVTLSGTGASTYTFTGGVLNGVGFVPSITDIYSVTGTNALGCVNSSFTTVTVNSLPVISANDTAICVGAIATLTASGTSFFVWSNGSLTSAINVSPAVSKVYTVVGTSLEGCVDTAFASVTVNALPILVANTSSICIGELATISATGAAFYVWDNGTTASGFSDSPLVTTNYTVVGTSAFGCSNTAFSTVTVNSLPTVFVNSPTVCSGELANLSATGAATYAWSNGVNTATNNIFPLVSDIFTVTGTSTFGCSNTAVSTVTVNALPIVAIDGNTIICLGNAVSLTASGANNYSWSNGSNASTITVSPTATATYSVAGFDLNGCSASSIFTITVTSQPSVAINGDISICIGEATTLTGSGANAYFWSTGENTNSIVISPSSSQLVSVLGIVSAGCQDTEQIVLTINQLPTINISGVSTVCSGTLASLTATGASTYIWQNASTNPVLSINPTANQTVSVVGTDLNGCLNTAQTNVFVNTLPSLNVSVTPASITYRAIYSANVSTAANGQTYSLTSGSLPLGILLNTATGILSGTATGIGNFGFTVQANNALCNALQAYTIGVSKASLTIKAVDTTIYVVNAIPTSFVSSIVGLLNGDVVNVNYTTNASFGVQGTYAIKVASISSASLANYTVTTLTGTLTILPRVKVTISGGNLSRTYGLPNTLTGVLRFNGKSVIAKEGLNTLVGGDLINLQFTSNATINSKVATGYSLIVTTVPGGSDLTKYDIVTITNGSLQIKPSKITIKAFDYFVNYGDTIPSSFPGTVIGTVLAKDSLRIENKTDASTVLGVYLITPEVTGDSLSNYSFIVFPGNLYVRYGLTVTGNSLSRNYFTPNPLYSGTVKGLQPGGQNVTVTWISNAIANSGVGQYPITPVVVGSDLNLYYVISIPGALTVNAIPLTVSANNFVKVTGTPNPSFTASKIGLVNGEDVAVSFSTTADLLSSPGEYPIYITVSGSALMNYDLTTLGGTLFVGSTTSPITIPAASFTKVYGASEPDYAISLQGIKGNDNVTATYVPDYSSNNGVGIHDVYVQVSGTDINKYSFTTTVGVLNITAAPLEIRPLNYTRDYRSPDPQFEGTVIGLALGDTININYIAAGNISSSAGNYAIKPFIATANVSLSNYSIATFTGSLTISKVNVTVRGASLSKIYGDENPQLAYNMFGFVNGENITEIDVLPQAITSVTKFSDVGKYPVVFQSAFDNNYSFTYLLDSIVVVKATQTITVSSINARVKTGETLILTASASSNLPVSALIDDATVVSVSGSVITGLNDGSTSIRILQAGDSNYYPSDTILVTIVSTSTGIVSNFLFQISGQDSVLMNTSATYTMSNKEGFTYKWTYTGKNAIPSQNGNAFTLLFTSTSTDGKVIGQVIDDQGNILKSDSIAVHVITYTDAELSANPELQDKITAAALVQQLKPLECEPVVTDCENAFIESFNLGRRINNKTTCSKSGYGDFTTLGKIDSLIMGNSYTMKAIAFNNATNANYFAIWIDYGNDGSFDDPDDFIRAAFKEDTVFELKNVVIRNNDSYIGPRRVRVSMRTTGDPNSSRPASCPQEGTLGETEDYLIYVKKQDALEAPVLISPNDDGKNDLFLVKGINPKLDNKLTVLDRWGKTVFQKEGYENDWGGTDNERNKLEDGTYFYFFINGTDSIKGFFEIRTR